MEKFYIEEKKAVEMRVILAAFFLIYIGKMILSQQN
jgi:hypothetical protein